MKALIIGGSGGLSGSLAKKAMKQYEVWALTRGRRRLPEGVHGIVADRNEETAFRDAVLGKRGASDRERHLRGRDRGTGGLYLCGKQEEDGAGLRGLFCRMQKTGVRK